jgi:hypothetical protein
MLSRDAVWEIEADTPYPIHESKMNSNQRGSLRCVGIAISNILTSSPPVSSPTAPAERLRFSFCPLPIWFASVSALDSSPLPNALSAPAPFSAARLPK